MTKQYNTVYMKEKKEKKVFFFILSLTTSTHI